MLAPQDVYRLDINARWWGVPTELLMENAGRGVAEVILERFPEAKKVVVVASKTNNGGDGLVAARHLARKLEVAVILIGYPELIRTKEARLNWEYIEKSSVVKKHIVKRKEDVQRIINILESADIVVDAVFGVGLKGEPRGLEAEIIRIINNVKKKVNYKIVSVDVPSGLDVYRGEPTKTMVDADIVVTFHDTKRGLEKINAEVIVKGIGIPKEAEIFVGPGDFIDLLKPRKPWSHKGDFGKILIVGGSKHYSGAPTLAALAALRTGADLAVIYTSEKIANAIRSMSPNIIVESYKGDDLGNADIDQIVEFAEKFDVVVVGPGLGRNEKALKKAAELIGALADKKKVLVDADGLKAIAKYGIPQKIIVTPHAGEFKILFGEKPTDDIKLRSETVKKYANRYNITILLKGFIDVISNGKKTLLNNTGNPGMTVGGTGDVLTGIIAAIWSQLQDPMLSAATGAFLSGLSGDIAFEKYGYHLVATDVIEAIPIAVKRIQKMISGQ